MLHRIHVSNRISHFGVLRRENMGSEENGENGLFAVALATIIAIVFCIVLTIISAIVHG